MQERKIEVLSPAGDAERLQAALLYGADAVYLAGTQFGMRAASQNFDKDALATAIQQVHAAGKQVYITCNVLPRNSEIAELPAYFQYLNTIKPDAIIAADLGMISMAKQYAPDIPLHISTQLGVVNYETACILHEMGSVFL